MKMFAVNPTTTTHESLARYSSTEHVESPILKSKAGNEAVEYNVVIYKTKCKVRNKSTRRRCLKN